MSRSLTFPIATAVAILTVNQVACFVAGTEGHDPDAGGSTVTGPVDAGQDGGDVWTVTVTFDGQPTFDLSNLADGGMCEEPEGDGGLETLTGPVTYEIASALEWKQEITDYLPDGGLDYATSHSPSIWVVLSTEPTGCDQIFQMDGVDAGSPPNGGARAGIVATLWNLPTTGLDSAAFPILPPDSVSDAGYASLEMLAPASSSISPDGGEVGAISGEIQLDSVQACGLSGHFTANFATGAQVGGEFHAAFCPLMLR